MNFTSQKEKDDYIVKVKQRIDLVKQKIEQVKANQSQAQAGEQGDYLGAAKAYMAFDPNTAMGWAGKADERDIRQQAVSQKTLFKNDLTRLEQLWKDNTRALVDAKNRGASKTEIDMYEGNIKRLENQLKVMSPETWGEVTPTVGGTTTVTDEEHKRNVQLAKDLGKAEVDKAVDEDKNGVLDNYDEISYMLTEIKDKYGVSEKDMQNVNDLLAKKVEKASKNFSGDTAKAEEVRKKTDFSRKLADDIAAVGTLRLARDNLKANPNDKTAKSSALTSILRKESGAAIGASEFMGRMKEWLSASDYQQLQDDMSGLGMLVAGRLSPNASEIFQSKIADNYMDKVNANKMLQFLEYIIPDYAKGEKGADKKTTEQYPMTKMINGVKWTKLNATSGWKK